MPRAYQNIAKVVERNYRNQGKVQKLKEKYEQPIVHPTMVPGDNNYLKGLARKLKETEDSWKKVWESGGYNGAHHIITKSVLKELGLPGEAIGNAPAVFHPLHNTNGMEIYFHDHEKQLELYEQGGIKAILEDFFETINAVNEALGIPIYDKDFIEREMFEAEIWARYWGIKWQ